MLVTTLDAKAKLEAEGLHVSCNNLVYANYRLEGGPLKDAFKRTIPDAEQFLVGRAPVHV